MVKENFIHLLLYIGAGLVRLTAILFLLAIIPCFIVYRTGNAVNGSEIYGIMVVVILHLIVLYTFREAIIDNKYVEHLHLGYIVSSFTMIELLVIIIIILKIAIDLLVSDNFYLSTVILFFCSGCDLFAAIITLTILFSQSKKVELK